MTTVPRQGWAGLSDSELLRLIPGEFDVWVTMDANLPFQQTLADKPFAVMILQSPTNRYEALRELVPEMLAILPMLRGGQLVFVPGSDIR
ncbi:hypothetical protein [Limnospira sp. Paracas R14]|uniref:hypothetical protein n=1 Tax=Limnospira sp. Paracas R14 TaxID=2981108 RepID=UPI0028E14204|nr:hypothetical protein [Limnospira sp. Paracas R14]